MALTDNITGYWKLDGNSNDSVGSNNGSDTNITYTTGIISQGAGLNSAGTSRIAITEVLPTSINWWINPTSFPGSSMFHNASPDNAINRLGTVLQLYDGSVRTSTTAIGLSSWQMFTLVWKGSTTYDIYKNGSFTESLTSGQVSVDKFGRGAGDSFEGVLDEIGMWSRELTSSEVTELWNGGAGLQYPFTGGAVVVRPKPSLLLLGVG